MVGTQVANSKHVSAAVQNASDESSLVFQALQKRLRGLRKRLRGLDEIQAKADAGQRLNSDQASIQNMFVNLVVIYWKKQAGTNLLTRIVHL